MLPSPAWVLGLSAVDRCYRVPVVRSYGRGRSRSRSRGRSDYGRGGGGGGGGFEQRRVSLLCRNLSYDTKYVSSIRDSLNSQMPL